MFVSLPTTPPIWLQTGDVVGIHFKHSFAFSTHLKAFQHILNQTLLSPVTFSIASFPLTLAFAIILTYCFFPSLAQQ